MFCYNCGNKIESTTECPFCNRILPPLNSALAEKSLNVLNATKFSANDDEAEFVPGELLIYERYALAKKRTLFGFFGLFRFILELFGDASGDSDFDFGLPDTFSRKDFWQATFSVLTIHRDRIIVKRWKKCWIPIIFFKTYGRKTKTVMLKDVTSFTRREKDLLVLQFDNQEIAIPIDSNFNPEGIVNNLQLANPKIQFVDSSAR